MLPGEVTGPELHGPRKRFNASTLQRFNDSTIQRFNDSSLQRFTASPLQRFNASFPFPRND
jgi:hypothetical protein